VILTTRLLLRDIAIAEREAKILPLPSDQYLRAIVISSLLGEPLNIFRVKELCHSYDTAKNDLANEPRKAAEEEARLAEESKQRILSEKIKKRTRSAESRFRVERTT